MTTTPPPVVFVGPTFPAEDVLSVLPNALIRPPVRRGDLYRYRILKHSIFLVVDGDFGNTLAISPREVLDVLGDGAVVIGASSMGALRAADCAPGGARGIGIVYRLYQQRAISSEDEVAVVYREDQPFPPLTESLVNIRVALRRAVRRGLITTGDGMRIVAAAASMHYSGRTWRDVFASAGVTPSMTAQHFLQAVDVKRRDADVAFRRVAAWLSQDRLRPEAPKYGPQLFGLLEEGRERSPDPLDGADSDEIAVDFIRWLFASGYARRTSVIAPNHFENAAEICADNFRVTELWKAVSRSAEIDTALVRFNVFRRAVSEARRCALSPEGRDFALAGLELANAHREANWFELVNRFERGSPFRLMLKEQRDMLALAKCLRRKLFSLGGQQREKILWQRK